VVAALVAHVGSGASGEADAALQVFDHLIAPPTAIGSSASSSFSLSPSPSSPSPANGSLDMLGLPPRRARVMALRPFAVFLKGMLDFVGGMAERNVRRLFRCLFVLGDEEIDDEGDDGSAGGYSAAAASSSSLSAAFAPTCAASPVDDVHIVVRKFLALSPQATRRRGIIGAVALLAQRGAARRQRASSSSSSSSSGRNSQPNGSGGDGGDNGLAEWLFEEEGAGAGGASQQNKSTATRESNNDDTCLSDATTPGLPVNGASIAGHSTRDGSSGSGCEEWVTAPLSVSAVREVRDVLNLAVEACARDPSLLGFLVEELARAVEGHNGSDNGGGIGLGVHAVVVDSIANRFLTFFQDNYIVEKDAGSAGTAKAAQLLSAIPVGNPSSSSSSSSSSLSGLIPTTLWGDLDGPSQVGEIYLQILPLAAESMPGSGGSSSGSGAIGACSAASVVATAGADSLVYLSSLVRLVAACELSMTGNAESIDAVLGCPIALADGAQLLERASAGQSQFDELPPRA